MNNLNTNDAMMKKIAELLGDHEIPFNAQDSCVMCFPHIVNIAVQHVLAKMSSAPVISDDEDLGGSTDEDLSAEQRGHTQTFESACAADPIGRCCKLVVNLRSSGQRRDDFNNWVKTGNEKNWFKIRGQVVKVPHRELLCDVATRWDSTYQMIRCCVEMRPVVGTMLQSIPLIISNIFISQAIDSFLKSPNSDMEHLCPSHKEWEVLQEFAFILSVHYLIAFSFSLTPR